MRYLSFLGIADNDRFCGYILDCGEKNGEKSFRFYGFRMEPNTDRLCLSLHSACQARYSRVLEANTRRQADNTANHEVSCQKYHVHVDSMCSACLSTQSVGGGDAPQSKSTSSLLGKFGSLKKSKRLSIGSGEVKTFTVQYLGHQKVSKVDGLDTVRPVVQVKGGI